MTTPFIFFDRTTTADDANSTRTFYQELFNWTIAPESTDGPQPRSLLIDQHPWGAIVTSQPPMPAWVPYVQVDDLEAATAKAESLGGTVVSGPTDWTTGLAVTVTDPHGAAFALWSPR